MNKSSVSPFVRGISRALSLSAALVFSPGAKATSPAPVLKPAAAAKVANSANAVNNDIGSQINIRVEKYKLANGLTVLLHEDHSAPIISYHTWFRVGSKNEEPGFTGIAHLFEHMMFTGAKRYTGEQFDTVLQSNGATNNAFTTADYTGYYENLPSSKLELVIDIESDRMENLQITPEKLKSERDVVKEERRWRVENNPMGLIHEAVYGTVYRVHPYRWPVIGYMTDLDNITLEKANEFYRTYYAPNNAVIVVAGDFKSAEAKKLIEKYYGRLKSQTIPNKTLPAEPLQAGARTQVITRDVQNLTFMVTYRTPKSGTDESYAMDLLSNIMGNGPSSRLHQRLVYKDQVATQVASFTQTKQDSSLFQIYVSLKPGMDFSATQRAVYGEMWRPRNLLVSAEELQKAKNQVMRDYVDSLKTVHGKAQALAVNEIMFGSYEELFKDFQRYNLVTADQIRKVAEKYLGPDKSTLIVLKPKKGGL